MGRRVFLRGCVHTHHFTYARAIDGYLVMLFLVFFVFAGLIASWTDFWLLTREVELHTAQYVSTGSLMKT
ncbi:hypothetical protein EYC80_004019 [Monilinia laxa]|uniref:Uncharacterized protein n=1 Tax=Monilinia laxa TaxID=61186 RepID=A0A5N6KNH2_MONLA|nr:hypothetical protein EYC80_004019 [Monilinia laxa]